MYLFCFSCWSAFMEISSWHQKMVSQTAAVFTLCYYCKYFGLTVCCCSSLKGTIFHCSLTWRHFRPTKRRWSTRPAFSRETALLLSSRSTLISRRRVVRERRGLLFITGMMSLCKILDLSLLGLQLKNYWSTNQVIICLINWIKEQILFFCI